MPEFELKKLSPQGIPSALAKVERYRLLNEPWQAESICRDILELDPSHQDALISLILAITDQFKAEGGERLREVRDLLPRLEGAYSHEYYSGIIYERKATTILRRRSIGHGPVAYQALRKAMDCYERAIEVRPTGDDSAIVRWNSCARMIMRDPNVRPAEDLPEEVLLE